MGGTLDYVDEESQHRFELSLPGLEAADIGSASAHETAATITLSFIWSQAVKRHRIPRSGLWVLHAYANAGLLVVPSWSY